MNRWIIFDVDGTLIETALSNMIGLQVTMKDIYNKKYSKEDVRKYMGIPGDEALRKIGIPESEIKNTWKYWGDKVKEYAHHNYVFDGVEEMLKELNKGYSLAIVTSKTHEQLEEDFTKRGLLKYFKIWICKEDTDLHKPNPAPLFKAMELGGFKAEEAIYLGDAFVDKEAAIKAGMEFGHCRFMEQYYLVECNIIFNNPQDIVKYFSREVWND